MIEHCEFDTIYHEHLCYFSLTTLVGLFKRHGMIITDAERLPIHGGTLRISARKEIMTLPEACLVETLSSVQHLLREETQRGVNNLRFFASFEARVQDLGFRLREVLHELKSNGGRIAAYGASAKGSTLLNYFGIDRTIIDYVVDRNELKHN